MTSEPVSHVGDDDYLPTPTEFVWEKVDKIAEVSTEDWQERRSLSHGPLTESDDEVRVIRFNNTMVQGASIDGSIEAVGKYQRRCWLSLTSAGLIWGGLSGAAFSLNKFPIAPSAALLGSVGIVVLSLTLFRLGKAA